MKSCKKRNEILLTSQRKEMIDSSLDIKKEQNENKNERHQDSSKVSFGNFLNLNIEKEENHYYKTIFNKKRKRKVQEQKNQNTIN